MDCKIAIIEFGDNEKEESVLIQGAPEEVLNQPAHTYYYSDDITLEEAYQEILDLKEHYEIIWVLSPLPEHLQDLLCKI